jgi:WD40 repeat protein
LSTSLIRGVLTFWVVLQDAIIHIYTWDGKELGKGGKLEGNKGVVSALSFSPDGVLLASGDVSTTDPSRLNEL